MSHAEVLTKSFPDRRPDSPAKTRSVIDAPLRFEGRGYYNAPPERLFAVISEPANLHKWLVMIRTVDMDHTKSEQPSECGVGSVRHCSFTGMGDVDEQIVWWDPPRGYGFRFTPQGRMRLMMPTRDHFMEFLSNGDGRGGSVFTMRAYFNWRGVLMRHMAARMMPMMLNKMLGNLQRELGGTGGKMRRVV